MVMIHVATPPCISHLHNDRKITHTAAIPQGLQQIFCISQVLQLVEETEVCGRGTACGSAQWNTWDKLWLKTSQKRLQSIKLFLLKTFYRTKSIIWCSRVLYFIRILWRRIEYCIFTIQISKYTTTKTKQTYSAFIPCNIDHNVNKAKQIKQRSTKNILQIKSNIQ